jgi:hypothetical protein
MVTRSPLVFVNGGYSQLPPSDYIDGVSLGTLVAGSGLIGGGNLTTGDKTLDVSIAPNASGLIFVGDSIGLDGTAQVAGVAALASGNAALSLASETLASGIAVQAFANTALASGNAALSAAVGFVPDTVSFTAASTIRKGNPVGLDDTGRVQAVISGSPRINSLNNFIGIAEADVSSGSVVPVSLPDSFDYNQTGLTVGALYFVNPTTSGFTTASGQPTFWSGALSWRPVAKAISSSGLFIIDTV